MTKEADLVKLEGIVTNLMERYNSLKLQKVELQAQLQAKDEKIMELSNDINLLHDEKSDVHGRVSNLLGSIEEWEKALDGEDQPENLGLSVMENSADEDVAETKLF